MSGKNLGPNKIVQEKFVDNGGSDKVNSCLPVGIAFTDDLSATSIECGANNVLRVTVSAQSWIAFNDDRATLDAATINGSLITMPCIELSTAGTYFIACPARWVKASSNPSRKELSRL